MEWTFDLDLDFACQLVFLFYSIPGSSSQVLTIVTYRKFKIHLTKDVRLKRFSTVMKACHHPIGHSLEAADQCWYSPPPSLLPFSAELLFPHIEA